MPPKEDLLQPFENVSSFWYRRKRVTLEWKIPYLNWLFVRPHGAEREFLWSLSRFTPPRQDQEEQAYVTEFLSQRYPHSCNRRVLFSYDRNADEVWLLPRFSSCGLMRQEANNGTNWNTRFDWKGDYGSFTAAPLEFFLESAHRAIEERPEVWHLSLQWTRMGSEARFWSCVSWQKGNKEEWEALITALFRLVLSRLPPGASHHWEPFRLIRPRFAFAPLRMSRGPRQEEFPEAVWPLLSLAEGYFGAVVDYSHKIASRKGPFVASFRPRSIKALHPRHHELMVALDLWREFGHKSGQLSEIEACLRQLMM